MSAFDALLKLSILGGGAYLFYRYVLKPEDQKVVSDTVANLLDSALVNGNASILPEAEIDKQTVPVADLPLSEIDALPSSNPDAALPGLQEQQSVEKFIAIMEGAGIAKRTEAVVPASLTACFNGPRGRFPAGLNRKDFDCKPVSKTVEKCCPWRVKNA